MSLSTTSSYSVRSRDCLILFVTYFCVVYADDQYLQAATFANNLFTDLAPIIALFGEETTKQFLTQSIGWWDDALLAMAPLGILTLVVGAIRVGGPSPLRTVIGRGREPAGIAESEFLSSTSEDVTEVWDKRGVARKVSDEDMIRQILFDDTSGQQDVFSMTDAESPEEGFVTAPDPYITLRTKQQNLFARPDEEMVVDKRNRMPPNLTLNAHAPIDDRKPLIFCAALGILLQSGVIAFQAIVYYYLKWRTESTIVEKYAFPLACSGLVTMCTGVFICSSVIERSTKEIVWLPADRTRREKKRFKLMWIQRGKPQQSLESFAIYREPDNHLPGDFRPIWGSYRVDNPREIATLNFWVAVGTFLCLFGFPLNFIGLRGLHYSATLAQLVATIIMAVVRAWVRRGLLRQPKVEQLPIGYELDRVALQIAGLKSYKPGPRYAYWREISGTVLICLLIP